eukprot:10457647-Ditylum_brightwellii.AAC.1
MTSMVKAATKEVTDDLRAEICDYMKEEFKSMVAAVETQFTAILQWMPIGNSNQHNNQEQQMSQGEKRLTTAMQQQAPITPEGMSPTMYALYPPTPFYSPYLKQQPNIPAQQYLNLTHGLGGNQQSRQTVQTTEYSKQRMQDDGASVQK